MGGAFWKAMQDPGADLHDERELTLTGPEGPLDVRVWLRKVSLGGEPFALLLTEADVQGYSKIRIQWGVDIYPPGASYEKGVRAEAAMVYVFFGKERLSSGSLLVPDSPYFIGLFLCESESTDRPFTGRYFQAGGRFVCVDRPPTGQLVTTEYPIAEAFTRFFGKSPVPDISGFGIAIDTNNAKGDGVAKAFIRKIEFVK